MFSDSARRNRFTSKEILAGVTQTTPRGWSVIRPSRCVVAWLGFDTGTLCLSFLSRCFGWMTPIRNETTPIPFTWTTLLNVIITANRTPGRWIRLRGFKIEESPTINSFSYCWIKVISFGCLKSKWKGNELLPEFGSGRRISLVLWFEHSLRVIVIANV